MRLRDWKKEKERIPLRLLPRHEVYAVVHQLPVDVPPHLFGIRLYATQRLAPLRLDNVRSFFQREVKGLGLAALTNDCGNVPGGARPDAVELIETFVLWLAVGLRSKMPFAEDRR